MIANNPRILDLAERTLSIEDLLAIKSRMVGTGFIGGKSAGFLLARKILSLTFAPHWQHLSEPHDSFYIGSDIFYSYLVQNKLWKLRMKQKTPEGYFTAAPELKEKMCDGKFSDDIAEKFQQVIEYFGASPIIIRSSSLLEDGFGNAFAGKYDSIFLANQGSPQDRYAQFTQAVRMIYQSTMNEDALVYRKQRGLDQCDEQMALLVQRVSGSYHQHYFFPDVAGVGVSHNAYVWNDTIDPSAGMLRLVFGLGTRAVNRVEGDYPRIVALSDPQRRPFSDHDDIQRFCQRDIDAINTRTNALETASIQTILSDRIYADQWGLAIEDTAAAALMQERGLNDKKYWLLTLDSLFETPDFAVTFKTMLTLLEKAYQYPVEIEFTVNFMDDHQFKINLLQCRPLQIGGHHAQVHMPDHLNPSQIFFESHGHFLGGNISQPVSRIIWIDPQQYHKCVLSDKYELARLIGALNRQIANRDQIPTMLIGPGRWGSTTPSLGVPVTFSEINNIAVLMEVAVVTGNFMPELSYGTHFFQDLVETQIFYVGLFPEKEGVIFNHPWLSSKKNCLLDVLPAAQRFQDLIAVYDVMDHQVTMAADLISQRVVCYSNERDQ